MSAIVENMTPPEFLAYVQARAAQSHWSRFAENDSSTGLCTVLTPDGIVYPKVADKEAYRAFLEASKYLTSADVDRILELEEKVDPHYLAGVANYKARLLEVGEYAKKLLPKHMDILAHVPIGVSYLSYIHGGAMPVPGGGDIVTISLGLSHFLYWTTWLAILDGEDSSLSSGIRQRLLAALPDLAPHVLGDQSQNGQFMYFVELAAKSRIFKEQKINRLAWLAETFIILHEFGHIIKGHTTTMRSWQPEFTLDDSALLERRAVQRKFEFEADAFAANVLKGVVFEAPLDPYDAVDEIMRALCAVFALFDLGESTSVEAPERLTHPPAVERLECVLQFYLGDVIAADPDMCGRIKDIAAACKMRNQAAYLVRSKMANQAY